jgi:peptidoglycan biosynthesis protein MviN/MurJ (putative lipid II flippase)
VGTFREQKPPVALAVAGCLTTLATGPLFLLVAPHLEDLAVVAAGIIALVAIWAGVALAGRRLRLFRKRSSSTEQPSWPALLFTLVALAASAVVIIYVVMYGAGRNMAGL